MVIGVVIVSSKGFSKVRIDKTGPVMLEYMINNGYSTYFKLVPDIKEMIKDVIKEFSENKEIDVVVTCGGTGCTDDDVTPEATKDIIEKEIPGIAEYIRSENAKNNIFSYISRGVCGIFNKTLIINLPGSPDGALSCFKIVEKFLSHIVDQIKNGSIEHNSYEEIEKTRCNCKQC